MSIKEKYGLTDEGVRNVKLGAAWTAISNVAVFAGVGILFLAMGAFVDHAIGGAPLPDLLPYLAGLVVFIVALFVTEYFAYYYQYGVIYNESGRQRIGLAERLRKLPLSFFGRRDLADLTETIMGDVKTIEHAYSHVLPELYGAYIMLGVAAVDLLVFDWRLAIAALWSAPVALGLLFGARSILAPLMRETRMRNIAVSDDIQEALECVREARVPLLGRNVRPRDRRRRGRGDGRPRGAAGGLFHGVPGRRAVRRHRNGQYSPGQARGHRRGSARRGAGCQLR